MYCILRILRLSRDAKYLNPKGSVRMLERDYTLVKLPSSW